MRTISIIILLVLCNCVNAASAHWTGIGLSSGGDLDTTVWNHFSGSVYGENGEHTWFHSFIYGHVENSGTYLKHLDFSGEMMEPTFNWWALALYGDIVSEATFASLNQLELIYYDDSFDSGGTLVENPSDFYMAFKVSEVLKGSTGYEEGMSWYGWVHVSIDENLEMTLLGADINLYGGAVTVGVIPEPTGGLLLLIGAAVLGLRRVKKLPCSAARTNVSPPWLRTGCRVCRPRR